jgi:hypothetical protein
VGETWELGPTCDENLRGLGLVIDSIQGNYFVGRIPSLAGSGSPRANQCNAVRSTLSRRLSTAPTPSVPDLGKPLICGDCGKEIANPLEGCERTVFNEATGRNCLMPGNFHAKCPEPATPPERKGDPYARDPFTGRLPNGKSDMAFAEWSAQQDKRHAAMRAKLDQTKADLDRPMLKLGGRFGKAVEMTHPISWPSVGDDEP